MLGIGAYYQVAELSQRVRAQKSCSLAREEEILINKAIPALMSAATSPNEQISATAKQLLTPMQQERAQLPQMLSSFCR